MTSVKHRPVKENRRDKDNPLQPEVLIGARNSPSSLVPWLDDLAPSLSEGIVLYDDSKHILYFSSGAERLSGWGRDEVCGKSISQFLQFKNPNYQLENYTSVLDQTYQAVIQHRDGRPIDITLSETQLTGRFQEQVITALVFHDSREEDAAKKLRAFFLANITHEFRTPLSSLNASVEFLLEEIKNLSRNEIEALLTSVHLSVTGLQTLIDNLLESIQIEAGRFNVTVRPIHLDEIIDEAQRVMSPLLKRRQQQLKLNLPEGLPQVKGDPTRLTQVLVNLLSNASKFGPTQQEIKIDVQLLDDRLVKISVADRGPGIPNQERGKIFQQYYRLGKKSNAQDGIGLGLWVVRVIVEEHGGSVGVEEFQGGGSIFWFTVPVTRSKA